MNPFPSRVERMYDREILSRFPWPIVAGYELIHRWMDEGREVHAAWQVRDAWENYIKFMATISVCDAIAACADADQKLGLIFSILLKSGGLSIGDWARLIQVSLSKNEETVQPETVLRRVFFNEQRPTALMQCIAGSRESFVAWRNRRFGHGVFQRDLSVYANEAIKWLNHLHDCYSASQEFLFSLRIEGQMPNGEQRRWLSESPLPFYHTHEPAGELLAVQALHQGAVFHLDPILSVQRCSVCGEWEAFYIDRYEAKQRRTFFLGFIQGHVEMKRDVQLLQEWYIRRSETSQDAIAIREQEEVRHGRRRDFQSEFEPPVYMAKKIADFVQANSRGVIHVTGEAGVGKSWLTMGLDHATMLPAHLNRITPVLRVPVGGMNSSTASALQNQLVHLAKSKQNWQIPELSEEGAPHKRFSDWFKSLMRLNGHGELVVAIDGLDELAEDSDVPSLLPAGTELPYGCYLILAGRPNVRRAARENLERLSAESESFLQIEMKAKGRRHRNVLHSYAQKRLNRLRANGPESLPSQWTGDIIAKANGSFLYVYHFCEALHHGVFESVDHLPGAGEYYPGFFEQLRTRVGDEFFEQVYARTLAFISVAHTPIGLSHLTEWGIERDKAIIALEDLGDFFASERSPSEAETLYRLGHEEISNYLTLDPVWRERRRDVRRFLTRHAQLRFGADWRNIELDNPIQVYLLAFLIAHSESDAKQHAAFLIDESLAHRLFECAQTLSASNLVDYTLPCLSSCVWILSCLVRQKGRNDLRPRLAEAFCRRGEMYRTMGGLEFAAMDLSAGIEAFEAAVADPCDAGLHLALAATCIDAGNLLLQIGEPNESLERFNRSIEILSYQVDDRGELHLREQLAHAHYGKGRALIALNEFTQASDAFSSTISIWNKQINQDGRSDLLPLLASAFEEKAVALQGSQRFGESLAFFESSIVINQNSITPDNEVETWIRLTESILRTMEILRQARLFGAACSICGIAIDRLTSLMSRYKTPEIRFSLSKCCLAAGNLFGEKSVPDAKRAIAQARQILNGVPDQQGYVANEKRRLLKMCKRERLGIALSIGGGYFRLWRLGSISLIVLVLVFVVIWLFAEHTALAFLLLPLFLALVCYSLYRRGRSLQRARKSILDRRRIYKDEFSLDGKGDALPMLDYGILTGVHSVCTAEVGTLTYLISELDRKELREILARAYIRCGNASVLIGKGEYGAKCFQEAVRLFEEDGIAPDEYMDQVKAYAAKATKRISKYRSFMTRLEIKFRKSLRNILLGCSVVVVVLMLLGVLLLTALILLSIL